MSAPGGFFTGLGEGLRMLALLQETERERRADEEREKRREYQRMDELAAGRAERGEERQYRAKQDDLDRERQTNLDRTAADTLAFNRKRQMDADLLAGLPEGYTIPDPQARRRFAQGEVLAGKQLQGASPEVQAANQASRPDLMSALQRSQARSRTGLQGDATRAPQAGIADGVVFTPDTQTLSRPPVPRDPRNTATQDIADAAAFRLSDATDRLEALEDANASHAMRPWTGVVGRTAAGAARKFLGEQNDLSEGLEFAGMNPGQQDFQSIADEWTHQYIVFLPRFRSGRDMYSNVKHAYFPRTGVRDPAVLRSFRDRRRFAERTIADAQRRGATPEQIEELLVADVQRHLGPRASLAPSDGTRGAPQLGTGATPRQPTVQRPNRYLDGVP